MGSITLDIEGWRRDPAKDAPLPVKNIHFHISEACHLLLEQAEEELQATSKPEKFIDMDPDDLDLAVSRDCGPLAQCQLRVYLSAADRRGHFHLVGSRRSDNSMVYSNAVLVAVLT